MFCCYAWTDEELVRTIREDLERLGLSVWMDPRTHGGESWWREIIQEIQRADVFVFALSNHSWRSRPCRLELRYAEKLGIPVMPLQVGPLDSMYLSSEERYIDYRGRTADALVRLVTALTELTAQPVVLPDPLPTPPTVPFEYLYRIAALMGPDPITPQAQDSLIVQLRRKLKEEDDEVAQADIVRLLRELRNRGELTVSNAREIEEILAGVAARSVPAPDGGATWLSRTSAAPSGDAAPRPATTAGVAGKQRGGGLLDVPHATGPADQPPHADPRSRGGVFISYRREDASHVAGRLFDGLAHHLGEDRVFIDVDSIEPGLDFTEAIVTALEQCAVLLAVIGSGWLVAPDRDGKPRLAQHDDLVRLEIEAALQRGVRVIPVLVDGTVMPHADQIPTSLTPLTRRHALSIRHETFRQDVRRIHEIIARIL